MESKNPQNNNKRNALPAKNSYHKREKPISSVYSEIDTDLARDNIENDITAADLQDL